MPNELKFKTTNDASQFEKSMARVEKAGVQAGAKVKGAFSSLASPLATIAPAIAAAFTGRAIVSGVARVFDAGRALQVLSRQTGASVAGLVVLQTKFRQAGLESDLVGRSIFRLQKSLDGVEDEENKGGNGRIATLGLNLANLKKLAPDQQFLAVGRAIGAIQNPTERTAAAMQIFGKAGAELGAVFSSPDFAQVPPGLQQKAQMMARNAAIFEQVSIKLQKVGGILKTFYVGVADQVATSLVPILDRLEKINLVSIGQKFGSWLAWGADKITSMLEALDKSSIVKLLPSASAPATSNGITSDDSASKSSSSDSEQDAADKEARTKGYGETDIAVNHAINRLLNVFIPKPDVVRAQNVPVRDLRFDTGVSSINKRPETRAVNNRPESRPVTLREMTAFNPQRRFPLSAPSTPYSDKELADMRAEESERKQAAQKLAASGPNRIAVSEKFNMGDSLDQIIPRFRAAHQFTGGLLNEPERVGFTGAKTAQEGFRRGLSGGAYGRTGNVFAQISGRGEGSGDPATDTAKNTEKMATHIEKVANWVTGGSSGGSTGGATATK